MPVLWSWVMSDRHGGRLLDHRSNSARLQLCSGHTAFGIWNMLTWLYDYNIPVGKKGGKQQTNYLLLACPETFHKKGCFSDLQVSVTAPLVAPVLKRKKSEFSCSNVYDGLVSAYKQKHFLWGGRARTLWFKSTEQFSLVFPVPTTLSRPQLL